MKEENNSPKSISIIDNTPGRELINVIKDQLKKSKEAKFVVGYFFLSGFNLVKDDFPDNTEKRPFLRMIIGNETTKQTLEELVTGYNLREKFKQEMIEELQNTKLSTKQKQKLKQLRDFIKNNIIDVRLYDKSKLHAKLYLFITNPDEKYGSSGLAIVGSSNFTEKGLMENRELNVILTSRDDVLYLDNWFEELWNDSVEFRDDLIKIIDYSGVTGNNEYPKIGRLIDNETLFKYFVYKWFDGRIHTFTINDVLLEFQQIAVLNAINIIEYYNGVILADSVGLGKSFITSSIIEEFIDGKHKNWLKEGKMPSVLLILPPSIIPQWEDLLITSKYFMSSYKFVLVENSYNKKIYDVYTKSENKRVGRIEFLSLGLFQTMKPKEVNKYADEYDLIVVDEAHKYRNRNTNRWKNLTLLRRKNDGGKNKEGTPNKFILLTATPLNNTIDDIINLIRIFTDDTFMTFRVKNGVDVPSLIREYKDVKRQYKKTNDPQKREELINIANKIKTYVLDEIMVLRTRKYIKEQFKDIKINGKPLVFKDPQPFSVDYSRFTTRKYKELLDFIDENLQSIGFEHTKLFGRRYVVFEEDDIENPKKYYVELSDLFRLLLGKRLESGIYPFEVTLRRIYEKEKISYNILKNNIRRIITREDLKEIIKEIIKETKMERELEEIVDEYDVEQEEEKNNKTLLERVVLTLYDYAGEKIKSSKRDEIEVIKIGLEKLLENMEKDLTIMNEIINILDKMKQTKNGEPITIGQVPRQQDDIIDVPIYVYDNDPKLYVLKQLLTTPSDKSDYLENVPSLYGKKILIFTQYKDTAYYLYHNLREWIENEPKLHNWLKDIKKDKIRIGLLTGDTDPNTKQNLIKRFSPSSNDGFKEVERFGELQILIATDVISEGVNLQDADVVVNYDLPWNPMIIVQRVGRVNRIGNDKDVYVINFTPTNEIEVIVGILKKLKEKINDITLIVGKDVKILEPDEEISIETFGEKIKDISQLSITDLENYGISDDFKQFISTRIPQVQVDEYKLVNFIKYELRYTSEDFKEIEKMSDETPYYTFINGKNELFSVYEIYRGNNKIKKVILTIDKNGNIIEITPIKLVELVKSKQEQPMKIENSIESLKKIQEYVNNISEEQKRKFTINLSSGFLGKLLLKLSKSNEVTPENKKKLTKVLTTISSIQYNSKYSSEIKKLLVKKGLIRIGGTKSRIDVKILDINKTIDTLYDYLIVQRKLSTSESHRIKIKHLGWYQKT